MLNIVQQDHDNWTHQIYVSNICVPALTMPDNSCKYLKSRHIQRVGSQVHGIIKTKKTTALRIENHIVHRYAMLQF